MHCMGIIIGKSIGRREGDKMAMLPFARLLWTLVIIVIDKQN